MAKYSQLRDAAAASAARNDAALAGIGSNAQVGLGSACCVSGVAHNALQGACCSQAASKPEARQQNKDTLNSNNQPTN